MRPRAAMLPGANLKQNIIMIVAAPTPDLVAQVRRLYSEGESVKDILAGMAIKLGTLYGCLDGRYPDGSGIKPARIPRRREGVHVYQRIGTRGALVARMWRTAEKQVAEIEDGLKAAGIALDERESNARTLAIVAKTLRELSAVDEAAEKPRRKGRKQLPDDDSDDEPPRDIEELRRELSRKIEALIGVRTDGGTAGSC
jgi:hypothetical protein